MKKVLKIKTTLFLEGLEKVSESDGKTLIGGFSLSIVGPGGLDPDTGTGEANNCQGGNCVSGCGNGQNVQCNTIAGCK